MPLVTNQGGTTAVIGGDGKPLCPPAAIGTQQVRIDAIVMQGEGQIGVQVFAK